MQDITLVLLMVHVIDNLLTCLVINHCACAVPYMCISGTCPRYTGWVQSRVLGSEWAPLRSSLPMWGPNVEAPLQTSEGFVWPGWL